MTIQVLVITTLWLRCRISDEVELSTALFTYLAMKAKNGLSVSNLWTFSKEFPKVER